MGRRSYVEKAYLSVMEDPAASPEAKVKAAAGLERVRAKREQRQRQQQKQEASAAPLPVSTKPPVELDAETIAELRRRGLEVDDQGNYTPPAEPRLYCREIDIGDGRGKQKYEGATLEEIAQKLRDAYARAERERPPRMMPHGYVVHLVETK